MELLFSKLSLKRPPQSIALLIQLMTSALKDLGEDCCIFYVGTVSKGKHHNDKKMNQPTILAEISSPNYPLESGPGKTCSYKLVSEAGSQISVNFLDMDLTADAAQTCIDFVQLVKEQNSASALIGKTGRPFCGQQLPNYPGPSVLISGISYEVRLYS